MNKSIKRVIAITIAIGALAGIEPTKYINLSNTVQANAAGGYINMNLKLKGIYLSEGSIDFDQNKTEYDIKVPRSVEEIKIKAKPKEIDKFEQDGSECTIEINGTEVNKDDNYERSVSLDRGENRISIRLHNGKSKYKTYTLNIQRGSVSKVDEDEEEEVEEEIYLSDISLSSGIINFSKETKTYNVNVDSSIDKIEIKARPQDSDYKVKIDDVSVNENDKYKRDVELKQGNNKIEIFIKDGFKENTYTLNIVRGATETSNTSNTSTSIKSNQWVQINGKWQYNDSTGKALKNVWFYDKNIGKNYYLKEDGTMATGWLDNNGHWYYLDQSGARQSGWNLLNGEWYYLDSQGMMKTGWFLDSNNKYYYLKENGVMAKNTSVGGYKLASNGAWIK